MIQEWGLQEVLYGSIMKELTLQPQSVELKDVRKESKPVGTHQIFEAIIKESMKTTQPMRQQHVEEQDMILIVHGFPNEVSALRFEWAWQHPEKSRRLRHLGKKPPRESSLKFRFRVMSEMLRVGPWNRLPLTVRWLNEKYRMDFEVSKLPPLHMPICSGHVMCHKVASQVDAVRKDIIGPSCLEYCKLCNKQLRSEDKTVSCFHPGCKTHYHIVCLAKHFLSTSELAEHIIPVEGTCLGCKKSVLWGDIIRHAMGCYQNEAPIVEEI